MSFTAQLKRFADKAKRRPVEAQRQIFIELSRRVIVRTPVDTGRAKANWLPAIGQPVLATTEATDKAGTQTVAKVAATAAAVKGDQTLFLTNSLPYALPLEYGHSQQSPQGMVRISAREFQGITKVVVTGLK